MTAKITSKYQVVLPKEIREHLGVHPGDRIDFVIRNGTVEIVPLKYTITDLKGIVKADHYPTIEEMDQAISDAVVRDYLEGTSK